MLECRLRITPYMGFFVFHRQNFEHTCGYVVPVTRHLKRATHLTRYARTARLRMGHVPGTARRIIVGTWVRHMRTYDNLHVSLGHMQLHRFRRRDLRVGRRIVDHSCQGVAIYTPVFSGVIGMHRHFKHMPTGPCVIRVKNMQFRQYVARVIRGMRC